jgi:glycosyltransferase involved in cell wall biosynthesis
VKALTLSGALLAALCSPVWGQPTLSILLPVRNCEAYLPATLNSAIEQTLKEIEVICVDDGSTDGSLAILKSYAAKDPRVTVLRNGSSRGTSYSRLRAIRACHGDYVLWLEPGDELFPTIAERAAERATASGADVVPFLVEYVLPGGTVSRWQLLDEKRVRRAGTGAHFLSLAADGAVTGHLWNKLWRGNILRETAEKLLPFFSRQQLDGEGELLLFWFATRRCDHYVLLPQLGYRYNGRDMAVTATADRAIRKKYIRDVCAVGGKIFAEEGEESIQKLARRMIKRNEINVFLLLLSLPRKDGLAAFGEYLAAQPKGFREGILAAMGKLNGDFYQNFTEEESRSSPIGR